MKAYDMSLFVNFIGEEVDPDHLAKCCDDACFNLSKFHFVNPDDSKYGNLEDQVYFLKALRDIFNAMHPANKQKH